MHTEKSVVWVLGAGFSRSLGAPLLGELFTDERWRLVEQVFPPEKYGGLKDAAAVHQFYRYGAAGVKMNRYAESYQQQRLWSDAEEFLSLLDEAVARGPTSALSRSLLAAAAIGKTDWGGAGGLEQARSAAVRLLAAEVSAFLIEAEFSDEKWAPYHHWAQSLRPQDRVLTFNYDLVLDQLAGQHKSLRVLAPFTTGADEPGHAQALCFKLHGCVSWLRHGDGIARGSPSAALTCLDDQFAIARPGPIKKKMIEGPLKSGWEWARTALMQADAIVFVGYRFPKSDASARKLLLDYIRGNDKPFRIHTVLGSNVASEDSVRLRSLLTTAGGEKAIWATSAKREVVQWPMWAEDFIEQVPRHSLFWDDKS